MMGVLARKRMLYKTKVGYRAAGSGAQVNDYAMNHVLGCSHGCKYPCYAMSAAMRFGQVGSYAEWVDPKPVENTLDLLERELRSKKDIRRVHLCFTTDPLPNPQPADGDSATASMLRGIRNLTAECVKMINLSGIPVTLLTKSFYEEPGAYAGLHPDNYYGISLVSLDESFRVQWEPGAAPYCKRLSSLRRLSEAGLRTWVSMEPYPALRWNMGGAAVRSRASLCDDYAGLRFLLSQVKFADRIVFGSWNYNSSMPSDFPDPGRWYDAASAVVSGFCAGNGIECVLKGKAVR